MATLREQNAEVIIAMTRQAAACESDEQKECIGRVLEAYQNETACQVATYRVAQHTLQAMADRERRKAKALAKAELQARLTDTKDGVNHTSTMLNPPTSRPLLSAKRVKPGPFGTTGGDDRRGPT